MRGDAVEQGQMREMKKREKYMILISTCDLSTTTTPQKEKYKIHMQHFFNKSQ